MDVLGQYIASVVLKKLQFSSDISDVEMLELPSKPKPANNATENVCEHSSSEPSGCGDAADVTGATRALREATERAERAESEADELRRQLQMMRCHK